MREEIQLQDLFDMKTKVHAHRFTNPSPFAYLGKNLTKWLEDLLDTLGVPPDRPLVHGHVHDGAYLKGRVYVAAGVEVEPTAYVEGPCYLGEGASVRHGAYVRGSVYAGPAAIIGHATEAKGSIFFDGAKAAHFAYVGDSILGANVNLGAGTRLANLKLRADEVRVRGKRGQAISTGLRKLGALVGDGAQTGCNAVLSPGTILFPGTMVLPCHHFHGTLTSGCVGAKPR